MCLMSSQLREAERNQHVGWKIAEVSYDQAASVMDGMLTPMSLCPSW